VPLIPVKSVPKGARMSAQSQVNKFTIVPAPVTGLDLSSPLTHQDPQSATTLDNFFSRRYGPELRPGSTRWLSNLNSPVVSLMSYLPPRGAGSVLMPKLFAACENMNIYNATDQQTESFVPPPVATILGQIIPGRLSWTNFSTVGTNYLCVCVAGGGYWTYDALGGWVNRTAQITGAGATAAINFDFVMSWKNRLWFIQNNTTNAWYLPTNSIAGAAALFDFGPLFVHGGDLKAMATWTLDAGNGVDDKLVIYSLGGDILIYEGTDPAAAATFRIVGKWYGGRPPSGRRFMSKYGGDLAFISEIGVDYMSRIFQGRAENNPEFKTKDPARRFNEQIGRDVRSTRGRNFWQFTWLPSEECAIVTTPHTTPKLGYQYCFSALPQAWSRLVGMGMSCAEEHEGDLYHGTDEGTVIKAFVGATDDQLSDGTPGRGVMGQLQSAFIAPNDDRASLKRPQLVQPIFLASSPPSVKAQIHTEWTIQPTPGSPPFISVKESLWDTALWDQATWSVETQTYMAWLGVTGLGAYASLRMAVTGAPRTVFTAWKYVYESGGVM
jgi:hypothetical protein